jgi:hypothetical protein
MLAGQRASGRDSPGEGTLCGANREKQLGAHRSPVTFVCGHPRRRQPLVRSSPSVGGRSGPASAPQQVAITAIREPPAPTEGGSGPDRRLARVGDAVASARTTKKIKIKNRGDGSAEEKDAIRGQLAELRGR